MKTKTYILLTLAVFLIEQRDRYLAFLRRGAGGPRGGNETAPASCIREAGAEPGDRAFSESCIVLRY